jgi:aromatic-L-amino-acid decarboxylase
MQRPHSSSDGGHSTTHDPLEIVTDRVRTWTAAVRQERVTPGLSAETVAARVAGFDLGRSHDLATLAGEMADLLELGNVHSTHPRYFGLFNPGVRSAGSVADALAALYNPQVAAWWHAPAAAEIERHTLAYLAGLIGFPSTDGVATFTSGGSEANLTGVLMALASTLPDYARDGLAGVDQRPVLYASDQAHDSFVKIARVAGLGDRAIQRVRSDARQQLDVEDLRRQITCDRAAGLLPFCVVATAGTTATGAIDPLASLVDLCRMEGLWLHVDAAWGGLALLSDELRPHLAGIEQADSVTWDAHKTLPVPMGAGMFFCRERPRGELFFSVHTGYVPDAVTGRTDPYQHSLQWSRRFIGLKVFLTIAELGRDGVAALIDQQTRMGHLLRERLTLAGWRVTNDTPLPLVCFVPDDPRPELVAALAQQVVAEGVAWISEVRLAAGQRWLRACVTHHETDEGDVDALVAALERARTRR